jgi:uroporphyrinogen-III decarboxylase
MACGPIPIQSFMLYLYDKPDLIAAMMERFVDYSLSIIAAIKKSDFQFYYIGDDLSSTTGPLISPDMIAQVWAPQYERIIRAAQETGKPIVNHCCGDQSPVLPYLLDWGVEATHPLQPGANDIYAVREQYGNRITLIGNMDIAKALSFGTEEEVAEETMEHIQRLGKDGSYVVCSSHSIIDSVIPENFLAMVRTAMEYRW